MTDDKFEELYCKTCGNQSCGGILDEEFRDGCSEYKKHLPYEENTTICGEDGCDGCFLDMEGLLKIANQKQDVKILYRIGGMIIDNMQKKNGGGCY